MEAKMTKAENYYGILWIVGVMFLMLGFKYINCAIIGGFLFLTAHIGYILENVIADVIEKGG